MLSCDSCGLLVNFSCGWNMFSIKTLYVRAESIISGNISHILDIFFFFRRKAKLVPKFKLVSHNLFTDLTVGTAGVKKICTRSWMDTTALDPVCFLQYSSCTTTQTIFVIQGKKLIRSDKSVSSNDL